jgi:hypothetical protein
MNEYAMTLNEIEITSEKANEIRERFVNSEGGITEISMSSDGDTIYMDVSHIAGGITTYKIVDK